MFTGIIENTGKIEEIIISGTNRTFWLSSPIASELKTDQSLSHNGVCLTVEEVKNSLYRVTAIEETILKTNLKHWKTGSFINLERCMQINGRLDGHIVQGHVDTTAKCISVLKKDGSSEFSFEIEPSFSALIVEKGSITLNGISLTIFKITGNSFTVAIIPYTLENTNISELKIGDEVNIEFDIIGKYVNRMMELRNN